MAKRFEAVSQPSAFVAKRFEAVSQPSAFVLNRLEAVNEPGAFVPNTDAAVMPVMELEVNCACPKKQKMRKQKAESGNASERMVFFIK